MADDGSDAGSVQEEEVQKPVVDYEALDPETGFKAIEWKIWQAYEKAILSKEEEEREDSAEWCDTFAEENQIDKVRVSTVVRLGIYGGDRNEFNERTGEGKCIQPNGDTYEGEYWAGRRNGKGKYVFRSIKVPVFQLVQKHYNEKMAEESDGDFAARVASYLHIGERIIEVILKHGMYPLYNGTYVNDIKHGYGIMIHKDGTVYEGEWKNNKKHGTGAYYHLNGDIYEGQWKDGKRHGGGRYKFFKQKCQYVGTWDMDNFVTGQWIMADGNLYEGKFNAKNVPHDDAGCLKFPKMGMVTRGSYLDNQWVPDGQLLTEEQYQSTLEDVGEANGTEVSTA